MLEQCGDSLKQLRCLEIQLIKMFQPKMKSLSLSPTDVEVFASHIFILLL